MNILSFEQTILHRDSEGSDLFEMEAKLAMEKVSAIILAAGKGKRTGLPYPKVLHPLCGKPMVRWVVDALSNLSLKEIVVVVSPGHEKEFSRALGGTVSLAVQKEPLGTAHALQRGIEKLGIKTGTLLAGCGDTPLLTPQILQDFLAFHQEKKSAATLLTAKVPDSTGYGRIVRNQAGKVLRIVEESDATGKEKKIQEINSGTYCFDLQAIQKVLPELSRKNRQREYYLTDSISWFAKEKRKVYAYWLSDWRAVLGINTLTELSEARKLLNQSLLQQWANSGVVFIDQESVYLDADIAIGSGTTVYPFTFLEKGTRIGVDCRIGPFAHLIASTVEKEVTVQNSVLVESQVGEACMVGPFAYLRKGTRLAKEVRIGDFVETKNSTIGRGSKIPHLSYIGDASIGTGVNVGAGVITCNYDGKGKYFTVIEDGAFIGSNTNLRAPVRIGKNAVTGAGSVVLQNVKPNTVVAGVPAKIIKKRRG